LVDSPGHRVGPLWDASANSQWSEVHQTPSHNSYAVVGGVDTLFDQGLRTFELDIHRQANYHAVDVAVNGQTCGPAVLQPPDRASAPFSGGDAVRELDDVEQTLSDVQVHE
jgi:hypothetical protein